MFVTPITKPREKTSGPLERFNELLRTVDEQLKVKPEPPRTPVAPSARVLGIIADLHKKYPPLAREPPKKRKTMTLNELLDVIETAISRKPVVYFPVREKEEEEEEEEELFEVVIEDDETSREKTETWKDMVVKFTASSASRMAVSTAMQATGVTGVITQAAAGLGLGAVGMAAIPAAVVGVGVTAGAWKLGTMAMNRLRGATTQREKPRTRMMTRAERDEHLKRQQERAKETGNTALRGSAKLTGKFISGLAGGYLLGKGLSEVGTTVLDGLEQAGGTVGMVASALKAFPWASKAIWGVTSTGVGMLAKQGLLNPALEKVKKYVNSKEALQRKPAENIAAVRRIVGKSQVGQAVIDATVADYINLVIKTGATAVTTAAAKKLTWDVIKNLGKTDFLHSVLEDVQSHFVKGAIKNGARKLMKPTTEEVEKVKVIKGKERVVEEALTKKTKIRKEQVEAAEEEVFVAETEAITEEQKGEEGWEMMKTMYPRMANAMEGYRIDNLKDQLTSLLGSTVVGDAVHMSRITTDFADRFQGLEDERGTQESLNALLYGTAAMFGRKFETFAQGIDMITGTADVAARLAYLNIGDDRLLDVARWVGSMPDATQTLAGIARSNVESVDFQRMMGRLFYDYVVDRRPVEELSSSLFTQLFFGNERMPEDSAVRQGVEQGAAKMTKVLKRILNGYTEEALEDQEGPEQQDRLFAALNKKMKKMEDELDLLKKEEVQTPEIKKKINDLHRGVYRTQNMKNHIKAAGKQRSPSIVAPRRPLPSQALGASEMPAVDVRRRFVEQNYRSAVDFLRSDFDQYNPTYLSREQVEDLNAMRNVLRGHEDLVSRQQLRTVEMALQRNRDLEDFSLNGVFPARPTWDMDVASKEPIERDEWVRMMKRSEELRGLMTKTPEETVEMVNLRDRLYNSILAPEQQIK